MLNSVSQLEVSDLVDLGTVCPMLRTEIVKYFPSALRKIYFREVDVSLDNAGVTVPAIPLLWVGMLPPAQGTPCCLHLSQNNPGGRVGVIPLELNAFGDR